MDDQGVVVPAALYAVGSGQEVAISQCTRILFAELLKDMTRRGLEIVDQEAENAQRREQEAAWADPDAER
jgi:hypothetical protein